MTRETSAYDDIADDLASYAGDGGGDLQRYIIVPAMLEVVGSVDGKNILDLYCGAGYLSRRLASLGGKVTSVDPSERLIGIGREVNIREKQQIDYSVAEPTDLSVVEDSTFDDIVCNMGLMSTRDLAGTVAELARLVQLGGRFIFSVIHPCFCMPDACWVRSEDGTIMYKSVDNYYREGWWLSGATGVGRDKAKTKHRTLSRYVNALGARGFNVRRIVEPKPSPEILAIKPELEVYERLPVAMIVEAVFPYV